MTQREEFFGQVTADEPGTARNKEFHAPEVPFLLRRLYMPVTGPERT